MTTEWNTLTPAEAAAKFVGAVRGGIFLTTGTLTEANSMYLNWGSIGYRWRRYVVTICVKPSRYTHELLEKRNEFTISVPLRDDYRAMLQYCGTHSGRHEDKISAAGLTLCAPKQGSTPVLGGTGWLHLECRTLQSLVFPKESLDPEIFSFFYDRDRDDVHTFYVAEITSAYEV